MAATNLTLVPPMPPGMSAATNSGPATNAVLELKEIKGPVQIKSWVPYICAGIGLVLLVLALWWWLKRKKKGIIAPVIPPVPPHELARRRLEEALKLLGDPKAFIFATSDAVRLYLEGYFNLRAPERTTEEFLTELQTSTSLTPEQKNLLGDFLVECDLVKFAGHEPTETALRELHKAAVKLVLETSAPQLVEPATK